MFTKLAPVQIGVAKPSSYGEPNARGSGEPERASQPNAGAFREWLPSDEKGYLAVEGETTASAIDGVFIAGGIDDHRYRQAITAAGEGAQAAIDAERWLETAAAVSGEPATLAAVR